jgi:hypothetical protein
MTRGYYNEGHCKPSINNTIVEETIVATSKTKGEINIF